MGFVFILFFICKSKTINILFLIDVLYYNEFDCIKILNT